MQSALDTALRTADADSRERFWSLVRGDASAAEYSTRAGPVGSALHEDGSGLALTSGWLFQADYLAVVRSARRQIEGAIASGSLATDTLEQLSVEIEHYSYDCTTSPPRDMLARLVLNFSHTANLLGQKLTRSSHLKTYDVMARGAALIADELSMLGEILEAKRWHTLASAMAIEAEQRGLAIHLRALSSCVTLYHGSPQETIDATKVISQVSDGVALSGNVFGLALSGVAHAKLGNHGLANAAIESAGRVFSLIPDQDRNLSVFGFSERRLLFYRGRALAYLDRMPDAELAYTDSRAMYNDQNVGDRLMIELDHATALAKSGHIRESCDVANRALLDLPEAHLCALYLSHARPIVDAGKLVPGAGEEIAETVKTLGSRLEAVSAPSWQPS